MKILNLVDLEKSDIKYRISKFPDGQQQVALTEDLNLSSDYPIIIKARLNNFRDLELIICATKSIRNECPNDIFLYVPYFLGSRSDRKFERGGNNYLKDVICPIINSLNFAGVSTIDPHSDVLEACLNNFRKTDNQLLVEYFLADTNTDVLDNVVLVSPDAGANKKIYKIAEKIGYSGEVITCTKIRDNDGKLTKTHIPLSNLGNKKLVIIDDICDGGATFLNIAKTIKEHYVGVDEPKIYLIVTHGIFSKGFNELNKYFDGIYCTNSYNNLTDKNGTSCPESEKVKQKNVF